MVAPSLLHSKGGGSASEGRAPECLWNSLSSLCWFTVFAGFTESTELRQFVDFIEFTEFIAFGWELCPVSFFLAFLRIRFALRQERRGEDEEGGGGDGCGQGFQVFGIVWLWVLRFSGL